MMKATDNATDKAPGAERASSFQQTVHRLQAASGALFAVFLALHLLTTSSAAAGTSIYDRVLVSLRAIYRPHPVVEIALVGVPALVHIVCALIRIGHRIRKRAAAPAQRYMRLHRYSGYVLLAAFGGHVLATRFAPVFGAGPTATGKADYSFLAFSLVSLPWFFIPYYLLLGAAGAVHLSLGLGIASKVLLRDRIKTQRARRVATFGAACSALVVLAGVSAMIANAATADRTRFPEFSAIYHRFVPGLPADVAPGEMRR